MQDKKETTQTDLDNHSNQLNPNNDAYWQSRGDDEKPEDCQNKDEKDEKDEKEDK